MSERVNSRKYSQRDAKYRSIYIQVLSEACDRGKLLSKAAARQEAQNRFRKLRVDRHLDMAQLSALREHGFI